MALTTNAETFQFHPIGVLHTCFAEKFGVPRQAAMVPAAVGTLKLKADPTYRLAVEPLESFSHIWIVFVFDRGTDRPWRPIVEPPRPGQRRSVGVFASRSPHRPNPIGISAVRLDRIDYDAKGGIEIHVSGVDILDGTPVLDVKPYLPYADCIPAATSGWASDTIQRYRVTFSDASARSLAEAARAEPRLPELITQMLALDPRPTSQRLAAPLDAVATEGRRFAFRVLGHDVRWEVKAGAIHVLEVLPLAAPNT